MHFGNKCVLTFSPCLEGSAGNFRKTRSLAFRKSANIGRSSRFLLASKQGKKRFETHLFPSLVYSSVKSIVHHIELSSLFQPMVATKFFCLREVVRGRPLQIKFGCMVNASYEAQLAVVPRRFCKGAS